MSSDQTSQARLQRRLDRERRARREAEAIAERTTSALYERGRELELLRAVASAANDASTLEDALQVALDAICEHLRWPIGHAYLLGPPHGTLTSARLWHLDEPERFEGFRRVSEAQVFESGVGLPGRVLASGEPCWIEDVTEATSFPPARLALEAGVRGAFAFPILVGAETVGVIEILADRPVAIAPEVLAVAAQVGTQLGRVVERSRAREDMAHHALHDALTGLPNRALLLDRLALVLARARRRDTQTGLLFINLDRFKLINDGAGHSCGDMALNEAARRLGGGVRSGDTVARLGGDEFVVLSEELASEREALELAERVQLLLVPPFDLGLASEYLVSASIGIAISASGDRDSETLLRDADVAMYRAKELGGARHELFNEQTRERVLRHVHTQRAVARALDRDELSLRYQPIVSLGDGAAEGVEALVRWEDPDRGTRPPAEFIPLAEESALILRIGEWVLGESCGQAARWRAELGEQAPLPVNVNLAARQVASEELPEVVARALAANELEPSDLALEITETAVIDHAETAPRNLQRLRALGVRVLLDDFGTGYSSLSYLQRFPVDALKIDRSFIAVLGERSAPVEIVRAIVAMGHSLGLRVIAEGVETDEQARISARLGCDSAQGYLFGRPAAAASIARQAAR
jgi:diguanylate cyclase (GGDEF)-like protein